MPSEIVSASLIIVDYLAVIVFAISGALAAAEKKLDVIGCIWLAAVTGIGGGTMRDLLLRQPVFWVHEPNYLALAGGAAILVYFLARIPKGSRTALLWMDAVGLAFVSVAGAGKALDIGAPPSIAVLMGVITGVFGGIVRDMLVQEPSVLLKKELYITASLAGALGYVGLFLLGSGQELAMAGGILSGFAIRAGSILYGWRLPNARLRAENSDE
ncbi:MAG TPA: trimeric intracellular cation channel family protein [Beijerinckiaceae bacterium]|nr:trimeric intracellular cation channel family protein [Beijerinckiaceae bacterium]